MLLINYIILFGVYLHFFLLQEYSEDSNSEPDVDLENQYYNSKALKEDDPNAALDSFSKVRNDECIFYQSSVLW